MATVVAQLDMSPAPAATVPAPGGYPGTAQSRSAVQTETGGPGKEMDEPKKTPSGAEGDPAVAEVEATTTTAAVVSPEPKGDSTADGAGESNEQQDGNAATPEVRASQIYFLTRFKMKNS